jgi:hypothetical protein
VLWLAALSGFGGGGGRMAPLQRGGYDADLLGRHLWSGVATGIGSF